jgi:hypothetical protein
MSIFRNCITIFILVISINSCNKVDTAQPTPTPNPTPTTTPPPDPVDNSDKGIMDKIQKKTFQYFWEFGHPVSGMALERSSTFDTGATGGTGFGIMAIVSATSRGWITRTQAVERLTKLTNFLEKADRFHGVWPHWMNAISGKVIPFSAKDNGGDLVETSYLVAGLLTAREYFNGSDAAETALRDKIKALWEGVEWKWHINNGDLYWHWSPNFNFEINLKLKGYNEALITYVLALASPTNSIPANIYERTWKGGGYENGQDYLGYKLDIGPAFGGPLFLAQYSFLGLDPRQMKDQNTYYWKHVVNTTLINRAYCVEKAPKANGYAENNWGLTSSDEPNGYSDHSPQTGRDNGTLAPTAALSSFPYTPYYSMLALKNFDNDKQLSRTYGFADAYNKKVNWYAADHIAIDQGPIVIMMENYRTGLIWKLFMGIPEIKSALNKMNIQKPVLSTGFPYAYLENNNKIFEMMKHPDSGKFEIDYFVAENDKVVIDLMDEKGENLLRNLLPSQSVTGAGILSFSDNITEGKYQLRLTVGTKIEKLAVWLH